MKPLRIFLGRTIPLSLNCIYVNQHRMIQLPGLTENLHHSLYIMSIHRAQIGNSHIFEQHAWNHKLLNTVLGPADLVHQPASNYRNLRKCSRHILFQSVICLIGTNTI